jgi:hypothetical protein
MTGVTVLAVLSATAGCGAKQTSANATDRPAPLMSVPTSTVPPMLVSPSASALKARLGVQVYWHTSGDSDQVRATADQVFDYVVSLGANSVGLTFPFFTDGVTPTRVYATPETPAPATLAVVIDEARARGLDVMLRPVLDEGNLNTVKNAWRGSIKPRDPAAWFASYGTFLTPYLQLAQTEKVTNFVIGTELVSLDSQTALWRALVVRADATYHGELSYADNWDAWRTGKTRSPTATTGLDAYPVVSLDDSATPAQLTDAWTSFLQSRPPAVLKQTLIQEIGIPAAAGSYRHPYAWGGTGTPIDPQIQQNWFTAACQSAKTLGMSGMYFWSVDSNATQAGAATAPSGSFMGRSDDAIKTCFASGWK